jgi:hypothetical protein
MKVPALFWFAHARTLYVPAEVKVYEAETVWEAPAASAT